MSYCSICGKETLGYSAYRCTYCGKNFCGAHRLPEQHNCTHTYENTKKVIRDNEKTIAFFSVPKTIEYLPSGKLKACLNCGTRVDLKECPNCHEYFCSIHFDDTRIHKCSIEMAAEQGNEEPEDKKSIISQISDKIKGLLT